MMYMKRSLAALTISALVISGAAVFATTTSATTDTSAKATGITRGAHGNRLEEMLTKLVEKGYLDSATKDTVLAAAKNFKPEAPVDKTQKDVTAKHNGERPSGDPILTALKDKGLITADVYTAVTAALDKLEASQKETRYGDLVKSGAFADATAADKAFTALQEQLRTKMEAQHKANETTVKTDDTATKAKLMDAERQQMKTKMQAERDQNTTDALAALVTAGTITQTQSDAMKAFIGKESKTQEDSMTQMQDKMKTAYDAKVNALVTAGTFSDAAAVEKAVKTFHEKEKAQMDANRAAMKQAATTDKTGTSSDTDRQKTMEAFKAAHEKTVTDILAAMVTSGDITAAQSDALKTFVEGNGFGGFGGASHHGGPEHGPADASATAQ